MAAAPEAPADTDPRWVMAGTEGTGSYRVIACSDAGRLGMRNLPNGTVRVRVEPSGPDAAAALAEGLKSLDDWSQPTGSVGEKHYRFSRVVAKGTDGVETIEAALKLLIKLGKPEWNTSERLWRKHVKS